MKNKLINEIIVDKIITPAGDYLVVPYRHDDPMFSGDYVLSGSSSSEDLIDLASFLSVNNEIVFDAEDPGIYMNILPGGTFEDILRSEHVTKAIYDGFREHHNERDKGMSSSGHSFLSNISQDEWSMNVRKHYMYRCLDQLIRKTSINNLPWNSDKDPRTLIFFNGGFFLADGGTGSNCGYGTAGASVYEIINTGERELNVNTRLSRETLTAKQYPGVSLSYLSGSCHNPSKLKELSERGIVVNHEGNLAFITFDDEFPKELLNDTSLFESCDIPLLDSSVQ